MGKRKQKERKNPKKSIKHNRNTRLACYTIYWTFIVQKVMRALLFSFAKSNVNLNEKGMKDVTHFMVFVFLSFICSIIEYLLYQLIAKTAHFDVCVGKHTHNTSSILIGKSIENVCATHMFSNIPEINFKIS